MTIHDRAIRLLAWLYVFLLPWQTQWILRAGTLNGGTWEYGRISLYVTDLLFLCLVAFAALGRRSTPRRLHTVEAILLSFLAIAGFSSFFSPDQLLGWYAFVRLLIGVGLFFFLFRQRAIEPASLATAFIAGAVVQAGLAIGEFFTQTTPISTLFGLPLHDPGAAGTPVVETSAGRLLRPAAAFPHPNVLGGYLTAALLLLSGSYVKLYDTIRGWFRRHPASGHRMLNEQDRRAIGSVLLRLTAILVAAVTLTFGLVLSFSRSAWLGAAAGFTALALIALLRRTPFRLWLLGKFLLFVLLAAVIASAFAPGAFTSRVTVSDRLEARSIDERRQGIDDAFTLLRERWHTGVGIGRYTLAVHDEVARNRPAYAYQPVHSLYLLLAAELSVFGLFVFLAFLIETLHAYLLHLSSPRQSRTVWVDVFAAGTAGLLIAGFFDHYLWTLQIGIIVFWLMAGLFWREIQTTGHPQTVDKTNP